MTCSNDNQAALTFGILTFPATILRQRALRPAN